MGHVRVHGVDISEGKIQSMRVELVGLPHRTIDRATALAWMADGHSLVPVIGGVEHTALQLVEVPAAETVEHFIRTDNAPTAQDELPGLAPVEAT